MPKMISTENGDIQKHSDHVHSACSSVQNDSSVGPTSPSAFLRLPREIRDQVYGYVCSSECRIVHICHKNYTDTGIAFVNHSCLATTTDAQAQLSFDSSAKGM